MKTLVVAIVFGAVVVAAAVVLVGSGALYRYYPASALITYSPGTPIQAPAGAPPPPPVSPVPNTARWRAAQERGCEPMPKTGQEVFATLRCPFWIVP
jgi:hypothetical protein